MEYAVIKQLCKYGHDTFIVGRDSSGYCRECSRQKDREEYKNNPEKIKIKNNKWKQNNLDVARACVNDWVLRNKERVLKRIAIWRKMNPNKVNEYNKQWRQKNSKLVYSYSRKNQLKRLKRVPDFGQEGIPKFYADCPEGYDVDHIIPLNGKLISGLHVIWNLQYLPKRDNIVKGNKWEAKRRESGL